MYPAFTALTLGIIGLAAFGSPVSSRGAPSTAAYSSRARPASSDGRGTEEEGQGGSEERRAEEEGRSVREVYGGGEEEGRSVREVYEAVSTLSTGSTERFFSGRFLIPFYTWIPTQENRALQQAEEKVRRLSLDLIARRRQEQALAMMLACAVRSSINLLPLYLFPLSPPTLPPSPSTSPPSLPLSPQGVPRKDLLAVMLAARDDVSNEQMTDQQLVDECVTFLVAGQVTIQEQSYPPPILLPPLSPIPSGHETTAKLLTWAVYLLARYPEWQRRVREEVWRVVGRRHCGSSPRPLPSPAKQASKHVSLGPYSLPAGTRITMAISIAQSDPRFWGKDALEFNPARFKDGIQGACSHPQAFLPFSAGPRDCIGSNFALSEAKVVLAHMLSCLEWDLSPTYVHLSTMGIALSPKYGMPLRMRLVE
ncbi:unnamed protein product [Closterium sp. Yama58-4]|nr:unnamed protein product [Closterium sp. Yama58-4]